MAIEKFNIAKASHLRVIYKKNRKANHVKLVDFLIFWQYFFGDESIVATRISLPYCCKRKVIEEVLNDCGYHLTLFAPATLRGFRGESRGNTTIFSFSPGAD